MCQTFVPVRQKSDCAWYRAVLRGHPGSTRYPRITYRCRSRLLSSESVPSDNGSRSRSKQVTVERLIVVGYILALAMPPIGFAIGLVLVFSPSVRSRHGVWIVVLSIVAAVIWALMISAGALKDTNQGY